jgi:hypothetical protein
MSHVSLLFHYYIENVEAKNWRQTHTLSLLRRHGVET